MIHKLLLEELYLNKGLSSAEIARKLKYSPNKVDYWIQKHGIQKRSISAAIYQKRNPDGDPFRVRKPKNIDEAILYGMGIGLYWGEGTKRNKLSTRLGNSDPFLLKKFIQFLEVMFCIDVKRLKFGIQIFGDMHADTVLAFWMKALKTKRSQFYKPIVTPHRGVGNYRQKTKYGVVTLYFNNRKLRDIICRAIEEESKQ